MEIYLIYKYEKHGCATLLMAFFKREDADFWVAKFERVQRPEDKEWTWYEISTIEVS